MNRTDRIITILVILFLGGLILLGCLWYHALKQIDSIEKIDSLDSKIDSIYIIKDSILEKIDTVYVKLEDNNKQYEENINNIIDNDVSEDHKFFLDYISTNRTRLDSISNSF